jgi:NADP-dependent 3-hydroxy acid dehydrogenase YdfG
MLANNKIQDLFNVHDLVVVVTRDESSLNLYVVRALNVNEAKTIYIIKRRKNTLREATKIDVNDLIKLIVNDVSDKSSLIKIVKQVRQKHYVKLLNTIKVKMCANLY